MRALCRLSLLMLVLLGGTACSPAPDAQAPGNAAKPFFERPFLVGAHRGGASVVPENTVFGFRQALQRWPGILLETDAALTADGHVVLLHDETVERTTNGSGPVRGLTLAQVKELDAAYHFTLDGGESFPYRGQGITVATLKEALEALPEARFLVEFKPHPGIVDATIEVVRAAHARDRVLLASFKPDLMRRARELEPGMAMCFDFDNGARMLEALRGDGWETYEPEADVLSLMRAMVGQFALTPQEIRRIQEKGVRFQVHTVDEPDEIRRFLEMGADSILSDRPDVLVKVVRGWQAEQRGQDAP